MFGTSVQIKDAQRTKERKTNHHAGCKDGGNTNEETKQKKQKHICEETEDQAGRRNMPEADPKPP